MTIDKLEPGAAAISGLVPPNEVGEIWPRWTTVPTKLRQKVIGMGGQSFYETFEFA
jgi:hypothetical protein